MGNTSALDRWNERHAISKEEVDLSAWDLSKGGTSNQFDTSATKMRRERLLAIRSAVLKAAKKMAQAADDMDDDMMDNEDEEDNTDNTDMNDGFGGKKAPPFKKKTNGK
jgi:hypothetical protein